MFSTTFDITKITKTGLAPGREHRFHKITGLSFESIFGSILGPLWRGDWTIFRGLAAWMALDGFRWAQDGFQEPTERLQDPPKRPQEPSGPSLRALTSHQGGPQTLPRGFRSRSGGPRSPRRGFERCPRGFASVPRAHIAMAQPLQRNRPDPSGLKGGCRIVGVGQG